MATSCIHSAARTRSTLTSRKACRFGMLPEQLLFIGKTNPNKKDYYIYNIYCMYYRIIELHVIDVYMFKGMFNSHCNSEVLLAQIINPEASPIYVTYVRSKCEISSWSSNQKWIDDHPPRTGCAYMTHF